MNVAWISLVTGALLAFSGRKLGSKQKNGICPPKDDGGWTQYYTINPEQNVTVEEVLDCWAQNDAKLYDHSMPVMISTRNLSKYREYPAHKLRNKTDSQKYKALKNEILKNGIREPLYVIVGKDGSAKIGEGNHRHNIALELRIPKVPVMFAFWDSAK